MARRQEELLEEERREESSKRAFPHRISDGRNTNKLKVYFMTRFDIR